MKSIRKSLALSAADSYLSLVLQMISTVIIARILTPEQTGIFAIAAVFTGLASAFRNFGVTEYLIQEKNLDAETIRAALTVNIAVSWAMGLLLFIAAPWVADFFRTPGVVQVMRVQALSFLLIPFGAVTMAYFRRELNLRPILIASALSNCTSFVVSISLALTGHGYMSLAWSGLAGVMVSVSVSIWYRPATFPRWPGTKGVGRAVGFGKHASSMYLFGQVGHGAPEMIIGRALDAVSVAFYSRANGLVELFDRLVISAVWPVCLPYFAKAERESGSLRVAYMTGVSYLTAVSWPILIFLGIASFSVIRIIYGTQWMASVGLAQILCAAAFIHVTYQLAKESLLAKGEVRESNYLQMIIQGSRVVGLFAVVPWGLPGACCGLLVATVVGAVFSHRQLRRSIALSFKDVIAACHTSLWMALLANAPVALWALLDPISEANYLLFGIVGGAVTGLTWACCLRLFRHRLWDEGIDLVGGLRRKLFAG